MHAYGSTQSLDALDALAADVLATIDTLGATVRLVGISYGGIVALQVAATRPSAVSELALISSAYRFSAEGARRVQRQIDCAMRGDLAALVEDLTSVFRRPWLNWLVRARVRMRRGRLAGVMSAPEAIVRGLRAVLDAPLEREQLSRITARTLIIGGSRDQFFGDGRFEETAAALPNASLALLPDETHMVAIERRTAVAAKLREHLVR